MNRTTAPELNLIDRLEINNFKSLKLSNEVPVYVVDAPQEEMVKVELRFHAGRWYESEKGIARASVNLSKKGTSTKNSKQLADAIEFYGAHLETSHGVDTSAVTVVTLDKYLDKILPVVEEILTDAIYSREELNLFVEKQIQKLRINAQNTDFHADRKFSSVLFGENHPYGYSLIEKDYENLSREKLSQFAKSHFNPGNAIIFVAGKVTDNTLSLIEKHFGGYKKINPNIAATDKSVSTEAEDKFYIEKSDSVQSSIRIGKLTIPKTHPDFPELNVLNTLFGGYFGSRLMDNIREDKGYTYGIYSSISHYEHNSYFSIETEVGNEVCKAALDEIYKEMKTMRTVPVSEDELTIVKNYMMGNLLRATDGPYNRIGVIKNIVLSNVGLEYFDKLVGAIKNITADRLIELANIYLTDDHLKEVTCGNYK